MELPPRARGDELLKPGELAGVRLRLRRVAADHDLATVIACAFDHRTRMLPFLFVDKVIFHDDWLKLDFGPNPSDRNVSERERRRIVRRFQRTQRT